MNSFCIVRYAWVIFSAAKIYSFVSGMVHWRNNPSLKLNLDIQSEELLRISKNILKDVWSHILERETEILVSFPFSALLATISPSTTHLYPVSKIEEGSKNYGPGSLTHSSIGNSIGNIFSYTGLRIKGLNLIFF